MRDGAGRLLVLRCIRLIRAKNYVYALFMNVDQRVVLDTWAVVSGTEEDWRQGGRAQIESRRRISL